MSVMRLMEVAITANSITNDIAMTRCIAKHGPARGCPGIWSDLGMVPELTSYRASNLEDVTAVLTSTAWANLRVVYPMGDPQTCRHRKAQDVR